MFTSPDQQQQLELIVHLLAKLYVVLDLLPDACPLCNKALTHDAECPILLAWSLLDETQQEDARIAVRAVALSIGCDDSFTDPVTH